MNGRFRNWSFTSFIEIGNFKPVLDKCRYIVYQTEICPSSGKDHIQGYVECIDKVSMQCLKRKVLGDNGAHVEVSRGNEQQNTIYCTKESTRKLGSKPVIYGVPGRQGNRGDLDQLVDAIEQGMTTKEILVQFRGGALRHIGMIRRGLQAYHNLDVLDKYILDRRDENAPEIDFNKFQCENFLVEQDVNALACDCEDIHVANWG